MHGEQALGHVCLNPGSIMHTSPPPAVWHKLPFLALSHTDVQWSLSHCHPPPPLPAPSKVRMPATSAPPMRIKGATFDMLHLMPLLQTTARLLHGQ